MIDSETGNMVMPVSPMGNNGNGMFGDGSWWLIILFVLLFVGNGWGNQNGANGLYPWMNQSNQMNDGFRDQMLNTSIQGINGQLNGLQMQVCNGFGQAEIAANSRQMADMNQMFGFQTAVTQGQNALQAQLAQCCCDNRLATEQLRATVEQENCADRAAVSDGIRDVVTAGTANTQAVLNAIKGISDQMCQDKIDAKNEKIAELQNRLNIAEFNASQVSQNNYLQNALTAQMQYVQQLYPPTRTTPTAGA